MGRERTSNTQHSTLKFEVRRGNDGERRGARPAISARGYSRRSGRRAEPARPTNDRKWAGDSVNDTRAGSPRYTGKETRRGGLRVWSGAGGSREPGLVEWGRVPLLARLRREGDIAGLRRRRRRGPPPRF